MKLESSGERHTIRFSRCRKCPHHRKLRDAAPPQKCTNCRGQPCHSPKETISCRKPINTTKLPRISLQAHPLVCCHCCRKNIPLLSPTHRSLGHYLPKLYHPMALRLSISSSQGPASSPVISTCRPTACGRFPALLSSTAASQKRSLTVMSGSEAMGVTPVKSSSLETATVGSDVVAVTGQVTEVTKETFWPIVKAAGPKVVVLDMYTQWCGPCKVMAPKFQEMSEKNLDVVFLKLDCNQDNRPLAKELGIRVVPTFKIIKDGNVVKEVTGAKIDELAHAIETVKSS